MKIIGQDEREESFIVTMTKRELAHLQNKSYPGDAILRVGRTVDINKAWDDLNAFQAAVASAATTLRAVADLAEVARANYIISPETPQPEVAK